MDPELWVQLGVEQHQKTSRLLKEQQHQTSILLNTMQKLQEEMERVCDDNAHLMHEQERIIKASPTHKIREMKSQVLIESFRKEMNRKQEIMILTDGKKLLLA